MVIVLVVIAGQPRERVHTALASGERVTGEMVGDWLGVSARTGRRKLAVLLIDSSGGGHG